MRSLATTLSLLGLLNVFFWGWFISPPSHPEESSESKKKKDKVRSDIIDFNLFYFMPEAPLFDQYDGTGPVLPPNPDWDDPEFKEWVDLGNLP